MIRIKIIIIYFIVTYLCLLLFHNLKRLMLFLKYIFKSSNIDSIPLHYINLKILNNYLNSLKNNHYIFIDFGCGIGNILQEVNKLKKFKRIIGIEKSKISYDIANENISENILIRNMSMENYIFENSPTIFYLYEPLWNIKDKEIKNNIYKKIFNNLNNIDNIKIIYISSSYARDLDDTFFKSYNFNLELKKYLFNDFLFRTKLMTIWNK